MFEAGFKVKRAFLGRGVGGFRVSFFFRGDEGGLTERQMYFRAGRRQRGGVFPPSLRVVPSRA